VKPKRRAAQERDREEGGTSLTDANLGDDVKLRPRPLLDLIVDAPKGDRMEDSTIVPENHRISEDGKLPENSQHTPPDGDIRPPKQPAHFEVGRITKDDQVASHSATYQTPQHNEKRDAESIRVPGKAQYVDQSKLDHPPLRSSVTKIPCRARPEAATLYEGWVLKRTSWTPEHSTALVCGLRIRIYRHHIDCGWAISPFSLDQSKLKKYAPEIAKSASAEEVQLRDAKQ
jgi:hypothetical protein